LFTHAIPAPPEIVSPNVVPEEKADQNTVSPSGLTVRWRPVTQTLDGRPVDLTGYEERLEQQVRAAQDHVQRHDGRVLEEAGVVGLVEVVGGGCRDTDKR
jgi:hypothetical protein